MNPINSRYVLVCLIAFISSNVLTIFISNELHAAPLPFISQEIALDTSGSIYDQELGLSCIANNGERYFAVWAESATTQESPSPVIGIFGSQISADGNVMDKIALASLKDASFPGHRPSIAYGKGIFLVSWANNDSIPGGIQGVRLNGRGTVLDNVVIPAKYRVNSPILSYGGGNFLVSWWELITEAPNHNMIMINTLGEVLSHSSNVLCGPFKRHGSLVSTCHMHTTEYGGKAFLYVGSRFYHNEQQLFDRLVSLDGVAGSPEIITKDASSPPFVYFHPALAFDGSNFLVVWQDKVGVSAFLVSATGKPLGTSKIFLGRSVVKEAWPTVAFDGDNFLVAWKDIRTRSNTDIYGARVDRSGKVLDASPFPISTLQQNEETPALSSTGKGDYFLVYSRSGQAPSSTKKVYGRLISRNKFVGGVPCNNGADCESGYCVDGVCCNTACGGGSSVDCQACSIATGVANDGTCSAVKFGSVCRKAVESCDLAESCDGLSLSCPADVFAADGTSCDNGKCKNGKCEKTPDAGLQSSPPPRGCACTVSGTTPDIISLCMFLFFLRWHSRKNVNGVEP